MQESRWDGQTVLTDNVDAEKLKAAMLKLGAAQDAINRAVTVHAPGSIVTLTDGTRYEVRPTGAWKRLDPAASLPPSPGGEG